MHCFTIYVSQMRAILYTYYHKQIDNQENGLRDHLRRPVAQKQDDNDLSHYVKRPKHRQVDTRDSGR